jgi:flagellar assembly protein FliH
MERQIRKRQGLYISKDAPLLKTVSLKDFSFEQICEHELMFHDNQNANLIFHKYHEPEELAQAVKTHQGLQQDIRDPETIVPILQPLDFTDDWRRQQDRASKRTKGRIDEDEEFELELEIARRQKEEELAAMREGDSNQAAQDQMSTNEDGFVETQSTAQPNKLDDDIIAEIRQPEETNQRNLAFKTQKDNLDTVGEAINNLHENGEREELDNSKDHLANHASEGTTDFIPVNPVNGSDPERIAMDQYEAQQVQKEEKYKKIYDEAKASGYEAGFKEGESKGVVQLRDLTNKVTGNVAELLAEMAALKRNILESAEENFMQVCQALAESLLEHEFSINPDSFKAVIRKAISEAMPDDKFKVRIHPAFLAHLRGTDLGGLADKLIGDEHIEPGSFKIESELSSIEGDLKQIISDLLEAAQSELFAKKTEVAS